MDTDESARDGGSTRASGFALGLFVGALVGAAVALLFAPGPGRDTRRHLQRRLAGARDRLGERLEDFQDVVRERIRRR